MPLSCKWTHKNFSVLSWKPCRVNSPSSYSSRNGPFNSQGQRAGANDTSGSPTEKKLLDGFILLRWQSHKRFINFTKDNDCTWGLFRPCGGQSIYKTRSKSENRRDKKGISEQTTLRQPVSIQSISVWPCFTFTLLSIMDDQAAPSESLPAAVQPWGEINSEVIWLHVHGEQREQIDEQTHVHCHTVNPLTWTLHLYC